MFSKQIQWAEAHSMSAISPIERGSWVDLPKGWSTQRYDGELPNTLYRYRAVDANYRARVIDSEICEERIFLSAAANLNDPGEAVIEWTIDGTEDQKRQYVHAVLKELHPEMTVDLRNSKVEQILIGELHGKVFQEGMQRSFNLASQRAVRVACFTSCPLNEEMWRRYGKSLNNNQPVGHGGVCIGYHCDESWRITGIKKVRYSDEAVRINFLSDKNFKTQALENALLRKNRLWKREEEWRILGYLTDTGSSEASLNECSRLRVNGGVKVVIFGLRCTEETIDITGKAIREKGRDVRMQRVVRIGGGRLRLKDVAVQ